MATMRSGSRLGTRGTRAGEKVNLAVGSSAGEVNLDKLVAEADAAVLGKREAAWELGLLRVLRDVVRAIDRRSSGIGEL